MEMSKIHMDIEDMKEYMKRNNEKISKIESGVQKVNSTVTNNVEYIVELFRQDNEARISEVQTLVTELAEEFVTSLAGSISDVNVTLERNSELLRAVILCFPPFFQE